MARLAEQYRRDLERQAQAAAVPWSYESIRSSKRLVMGETDTSADLLVIGQPAATAAARKPRILLLDGKHSGVLRALSTVLRTPGYEDADLMVFGEFDARALNEILSEHPQVTRRLMGRPFAGRIADRTGLSAQPGTAGARGRDRRTQISACGWQTALGRRRRELATRARGDKCHARFLNNVSAATALSCAYWR